MEFKSYCIIMLGEVSGGIDEIIKISESQKYLEGKGILISTFTTVSTLNELKSFFESYDRNFVLFELNNFAVNFTNKKISNHLFLDYENLGGLMDTILTNRINRVIDESTTINSIESISKDNSSDLINKLLEKGVENLTEEDKTIIQKLAKKQ